MAGKKKSRAPKAHHGYLVGIIVAGFLLPPLAVAMRFGIGKDFFINVICTICGYFPGHGHNFYLQNIRNNKGRGRTPKWALKYGLVEDTSAKKARKREWANRYAERTGRNTYDEDGYEDEQGNHISGTASGADALARPRRRPTGAEDQDLYAPAREDSQDSSVINAALDGDRDPGHTRIKGIGELPGAGERNKKKSSSGLRGLMGGGKSGQDRHARMEAERERHSSTYDDDARDVDEDFLNHDLHAVGGGSRANGGFRRPNRQAEESTDPLGADFLEQDLHQGNTSARDRQAGGLSRHRDQQKEDARRKGLVEEERFVDTSGNLNHRF